MAHGHQNKAMGFSVWCVECQQREALIDRLRSEIQALRAQQEAQAAYSLMEEEGEMPR